MSAASSIPCASSLTSAQIQTSQQVQRVAAALQAPLMSGAKLESLTSKQPVLSLDGVLKQVRKSLGRPHPAK